VNAIRLWQDRVEAAMDISMWFFDPANQPIIQTWILLIGALGAVWYAWDNRKIRKVICMQFSSSHPDLLVRSAETLVTAGGNTEPVPDEIGLSVTNVGEGKAVRVNATVRAAWTGEPYTFFFPQINPGKTETWRIRQLSRVIGDFDDMIKTKRGRFELTLAYSDVYGLGGRKRVVQMYRPGEGRWKIVKGGQMGE
jgi:hypothetical protein